MRRLILQTLAFVSMSVMVIIFIISWSNRQVKRNAKFTVLQSVTKIIVGHSHPEYAFNDSFISNFKNFARSGESFFYSYYKLIPLLQQNRQVDTVFIEFTNDQINPDKNKWIWGEQYISYSYPEYGPFLDKDANQLLFRKNPKSFLNNQSVSLKHKLETFISNNYDYSKKIGHYVYLARSQADSLLATIKNKPIKTDSSFAVSELTLRYLEKIIEYCKKENRKVYLVRSPLHPQSSEIRNERLFRQVLQSRFNGIEFLDFKDFHLTNDDYGNLEHLNYRGSRKFSVFFDELLKKGLLNQINKQEFINREMMRVSTQYFE